MNEFDQMRKMTSEQQIDRPRAAGPAGRRTLAVPARAVGARQERSTRRQSTGAPVRAETPCRRREGGYAWRRQVERRSPACRIDDDFAAAERRVKTLTKRPGNDVLLQLYSLYKQGSQGDVQGDRPGMMEFVERAKFDAWDSLQGVERDEARRRYVALVDSLFDD